MDEEASTEEASTLPSCPLPLASSIPRPQIPDHPLFARFLSLPGVDDDAAFRAVIVYLDLFESRSF